MSPCAVKCLQAGVYVNLYVFSLITGMMVLAGFVVAFAGYAVGGILAWACRFEKINIYRDGLKSGP